MRARKGYLKNDRAVDMGPPEPCSPVHERLHARRCKRLRRLPDRSFSPIDHVLGRGLETRPWIRHPDASPLRSVSRRFAYGLRRRAAQDGSRCAVEEYSLPEDLIESLRDQMRTIDSAVRHRLTSTSHVWKTLEFPKGQRGHIMNPLHAPAFWYQSHAFWYGRDGLFGAHDGKHEEPIFETHPD